MDLQFLFLYNDVGVRNKNLKRSCGWWSIKYKAIRRYDKTQ